MGGGGGWGWGRATRLPRVLQGVLLLERLAGSLRPVLTRQRSGLASARAHPPCAPLAAPQAALHRLPLLHLHLCTRNVWRVQVSDRHPLACRTLGLHACQYACAPTGHPTSLSAFYQWIILRHSLPLLPLCTPGMASARCWPIRAASRRASGPAGCPSRTRCLPACWAPSRCSTARPCPCCCAPRSRGTASL